MNKFGAVGWVLATLLSVWIATQAVAVVRQEVTQPGVPVAPTSLVAASSQPQDSTATTGSSVASTAPAASTGSPEVTPSTVTNSSSTVEPSNTTTSVSPEDTGTSTTTTPPSTSTTQSPTTTSAAPTSTTAPPTTTTEPPTTTTEPPPTTTQPPQLQTHQLVGGWVRILVGDGTVSLDAAAPAVGFTMDVRATGPAEVDVRFEADDHESRFKADWEDGELRIRTEERD